MGQIVISHRPDGREAALRLYAILRQQLPNVVIKPNVEALIMPGVDQRSGLMHQMFETSALIVLASPEWYGDWLQDINDANSFFIQAALTTQKMVFLLRYSIDQPIIGPLPGQMAGLASCMSLYCDDNTLYPTANMLVSYLRPITTVNSGEEFAGGSAAYTMSAPEDYPPNPLYPDSNRVILKGLSASVFQHPLDRMATENLEKIQGFDFLVSKFMEYGVERLHHTLYAASSIRVSERQYPRLHKMLVEAATILDVAIPELYVVQMDTVNALTYGHRYPYIVVYTPLLESLTDDEIMAVIAHEMGHIKCKHALYNTMATLTQPLISGILGTIPGFGALIKAGFDITVMVALLTWKRRSELSADRASLLVMQNAETCISMLAKLAGGSTGLVEELNLEAFLEQAKSYQINDDLNHVDRFYRLWAALEQSLQTHPFTVERAHYLNNWIDGVEFQQILEGRYPRLPDIPTARTTLS
jgi:Zn-dependent protease with chaperone function